MCLPCKTIKHRTRSTKAKARSMSVSCNCLTSFCTKLLVVKVVIMKTQSRLEYEQDDYDPGVIPDGLSDEDKAVITDFAKRFVKPYEHKDFYGKSSQYRPRDDSEAWRRNKCGEFAVTYSLPKDGQKVVASFWTLRDEGFGKPKKYLMHIDLSKVLEPIILCRQPGGYHPIPKDAQQGSE